MSDLTKLNAAIRRLVDRLARQQAANNASNAALLVAQAQIAGLLETATTQTNRLAEVQGQVETLSDQVVDLSGKLSVALENDRADANTIADQTNANAALIQQVSDLTSSNSSITAENATIQAGLDQAKMDLSTVTADAAEANAAADVADAEEQAVIDAIVAALPADDEPTA
jgi:chromosome segregation ATPase